MKVVTLLMPSGQFRVHKAGCPDIARDARRANGAPGQDDVRTALQLSGILWADQIKESDGWDAEDGLAEMDIVGCASALPYGECLGHESLNGADMGRSVTCDGTCN